VAPYVRSSRQSAPRRTERRSSGGASRPHVVAADTLAGAARRRAVGRQAAPADQRADAKAGARETPTELDKADKPPATAAPATPAAALPAPDLGIGNNARAQSRRLSRRRLSARPNEAGRSAHKRSDHQSRCRKSGGRRGPRHDYECQRHCRAPRTRTTIRGLNAQFYNDGLCDGDQLVGLPHSLNGGKQVEILEGPGSALFGSGPPGARSISFITRRRRIFTTVVQAGSWSSCLSCTPATCNLNPSRFEKAWKTIK
jgi:outer membrane receptor protein involved in Fe transport